MKSIIMDCQNVNSEEGFWSLYVSTIKPDGAEYFGRNLDAFWDAVVGGGPGWPGDDISKIILINSDKIKSIRSGNFYVSLLKIAASINESKYSKIKIEFDSTP